MNGAEALLRTLVAGGVDLCFANPGTSEIEMVAALDRVPELRAVLGLFEGVCTGAADGYGRMTGRPAATLLHQGPGLAYGLANLHNARRARTPVVNVIGDHASFHLAADPPLATEIGALAKPMSCWVATSRSAGSLSREVAEAIRAAREPPGGVASLVVPADAAWGPAERIAEVSPPSGPGAVATERVHEAAAALRSGEPALLLLGGRALRAAALEVAGRVSAAAGCKVLSEALNARIERGAGRFPVERLRYFPRHARAQLAKIRRLVLVGARAPVAFFAEPGGASSLVPDTCRVCRLAEPGEDVLGALEALADELDASEPGPLQALARPPRPEGPLSTESVAAAVAAVMPEGAIVVDEANTGGMLLLPRTRGAPPHDWLAVTGGALGLGLPVATGAALACPDRPVLSLQADGSAMYTVQALWTQARESLDITTVIYANRAYRLLDIELRHHTRDPGPRARALLDLGNPAPDWVQIARGFGVPATRAETAEQLTTELERSLAESGPRLIEVVL